MTRSVADCLRGGRRAGRCAAGRGAARRAPACAWRCRRRWCWTRWSRGGRTPSSALTRLSPAGAQLVELPLAELAEIAQINAPAAFRRWRPMPPTARPAHAARPLRPARGGAHRAGRRRERGRLHRDAAAPPRLDHPRARQRLAGFDALLCPTVPIVAPPIADLVASDEAFFKANGLLLRNTFVANFLDGCAFTLPCHAPGELPVGLMLTAPGGTTPRWPAWRWRWRRAGWRPPPRHERSASSSRCRWPRHRDVALPPGAGAPRPGAARATRRHAVPVRRQRQRLAGHRAGHGQDRGARALGAPRSGVRPNCRWR
jgi:hypothetical protein